MNGEVIKSFLVGLGFSVDDASLSKFNKALTSATIKVTALYGAIQLAASGIAKSISSISQDFEDLGYEFRLIAPSINKVLLLRQEMLRAYSAAGINLVKVVQQSVKFNLSLTKTKYALDAIYKSVGSKFIPLLTKQLDVFRGQLYANMPKIISGLETFVKVLFKAFEATVILGQRVWSILERVYDFFYQLHKQTEGWSTIILGVVAAWELLNLSFLATPLGAILAGLVAILALYDDFQVWKDGGKSFFNWAPVVPIIDAMTGAFKELWKILDPVVDLVAHLITLLIQLAHLDFSGAFDSLVDALQSLNQIPTKLLEAVAGLSGTIGQSIEDGIGNALQSGLSGALSAVAGFPIGGASIGAGRPTLGNVANSNQTNQNVNQQTSIIVNGAADAQSVGSAVAGQQSRVNYDMTKNLKPRTQ